MSNASPIITDIHTLPQKQALEILMQITRIEKRTFPTSEAFEFSPDLWRKKPNTRVLYAKLASPTETKAPATTAAAAAAAAATTAADVTVIAYAVYVRIRGTALLHKVCVAEAYRGQGLGKQLMAHIQARLVREGCQIVHLWVDTGRETARRLYIGCGFEEVEMVEDYYGNGRTGVKMVWEIG
ncbi:hypothetical protein AJ80_04236 [Polytolypa hystricis UAMH7299]|uniref:N-acetyltransferase domain-containing protein n=1 Tax=Polytolypa hystricis (strain UAMH7299) TaxID=1447883 RepID=A0A2B7YC94_POLH7|nr:hypothetical protein AJ80_04236 [Polytolypa hystricis UAMH7299]